MTLDAFLLLCFLNWKENPKYSIILKNLPETPLARLRITFKIDSEVKYLPLGAAFLVAHPKMALFFRVMSQSVTVSPVILLLRKSSTDMTL